MQELIESSTGLANYSSKSVNNTRGSRTANKSPSPSPRAAGNTSKGKKAPKGNEVEIPDHMRIRMAEQALLASKQF